MIKGWRNNPEWVKLDRETQRERRMAWIERIRMRIEAENYKVRQQLEAQRGKYVHPGREMPAGTIIEVPADYFPKQKSFWEFWK